MEETARFGNCFCRVSLLLRSRRCEAETKCIPSFVKHYSFCPSGRAANGVMAVTIGKIYKYQVPYST